MIFEVVNDRGKGLQPYEILKGKLLGNLDDQQKEEANEIWTDLQNRYYNSTLKNSTESGLDLDMFFRTYLRAKFANSEGDYEKYSDKYHYEIYRNEELRRYFGNFEDRDLLYNRVVKDIKYFADLYLKLRTSYKYEHLIYNKLLDQNQQYLLIMSNIVLDDPQEEAKIKAISKKFDQVHTTLRLLDSYESNTFQEFIYDLNKLIREKDINQANC
jgi:uncharacterized protein with ParB-like and HNH nuclease domain